MHGHKDSKIEMLKALPLFEGCSHKELEQAAALVDVVTFDPGKVAIREGEPLGLECLIVVDGQMAVTIGGNQIATLTAGDVAGELSLLEMAPRSATVTASTPVTALVMDPRSFNSLLDDLPKVAQRVKDMARAHHQ